LRAEIPIVNSASTDPTIPETYIPWYFTDLQDDRVQSYTLARRIYTERGPQARRDSAHQQPLWTIRCHQVSRRVPPSRTSSRDEQKFLPGDTDFTCELKVIQGSRADAIVLWADEIPAANILKQMRALGTKQRVFGSYRTLGAELLAEAGSAAKALKPSFPTIPPAKILAGSASFSVSMRDSTRSRSNLRRSPTTP